ncbi:MAG: ABC transporter ATP-binding protein, partial [Verrucomicrobiota bacterium]
FKRDELVAVKDLSLEVEAGQVYGLLGPNGSGKSTTMKIVLGLVTPTSGATEIFGRNSRFVESREDVGFLPENPYFYKFLTGEETLNFYGKLCQLSGAKLRERTRELLNLVGLENAADRRIGGYSKGMLQRIGLAQALIQEPRLLVLDEPTAGVDPSGSREIRDLILNFKSRGITVLLCSHLLGQVQEICDRIGILHQGVLVREGKLNDLISIESQTELILENATPELLAELEAVVARSKAAIVDKRKPQTNLERYFLDVTGGRKS